ncbi:DEAD/DEAH box helicase [Bdellovibrio sp. SKB1291214]|uniref:DEAD/DEAH box helicase n=1 Tax=Bdellovibrio sp. SKB1291214 TaxID=1732569 RepID=UPI002240A105|nr:DEAD/DEAH box helicase [Bdellovibrio sp. SKB1291214]UYL09396.1 DEAD/DEAH box helicase [Bdellovibrio sp. SKB1291214]
MNNFSDFALIPSLTKTLTALRITKPTEIQKNTIPLLMSGQSVVGISETGSGKTLAYALPMLHLLKSLEEEGHPVTAEASPRAVVLVPTRELGEQVSKVFKKLTHDTRLRVRPALGGMAMEQAKRNVSGVFEILLATPGRLSQLMDLDQINLTDVCMLVFDEADQMMDQGFLDLSNKAYYACPQDVQTAMFSATMSPTVQDLMEEIFSSAELVKSSGSGKVVKTLTTKNLTVKDGNRWEQLDRILKQKVEGGTILFANTREQVDKIAQEMEAKGYKVALYRGEMEKSDRRSNLKKFTNGEIKFLVATDLAGRGLDIENVDRVINYHLPKQMDNYLHRAGRTARAGREGTVINLVTERDEPLISKLEGRKSDNYDRSKYNSHPRAQGRPGSALGKKSAHKPGDKKPMKGKPKSGKPAPGKKPSAGKPAAGSKPAGAKPASRKSPFKKR